MDGFIGQSDGVIRLAVFLGVFLVMALIELGWPKRALSVSKGRRWLTNVGISVTDSIVLRLMAMLAVPVAAIAAAFYAQAHGIGLLNHVAWPDWLKVVVALLVLDLAIWAQHLVSHKVPLFWRLHQVHHADRDIDVTTAVRFHPVEIALVDAVEDRGGGAARRPAACGVPVRGDPQRLRHVQPRQYRASGAGRWRPSPVRRDPRHAPRASLGHPARARFKLRLQSLALGPAVPHLYRAARGRPSGHDHRAHALSERSAGAVRLEPVAAVRRAAARKPIRRSSSGNSAGTALHSDRSRAPARARN